MPLFLDLHVKKNYLLHEKMRFAIFLGPRRRICPFLSPLVLVTERYNSTLFIMPWLYLMVGERPLLGTARPFFWFIAPLSGPPTSRSLFPSNPASFLFHTIITLCRCDLDFAVIQEKRRKEKKEKDSDFAVFYFCFCSATKVKPIIFIEVGSACYGLPGPPRSVIRPMKDPKIPATIVGTWARLA